MQAEDDPTAAPAIVMVASGTEPARLVLPANAELGRRIAVAGVVHEVPDEKMSRDHATVRWDRGTWLVRDLDSRNGTFVDGERITDIAKRRGDCIVRLGHTVFVLLADGHGHPAPLREDDGLVVGPELGRAHEQIRRHADAPTLLVQGETGSGKEVAARLWHAASPRRAGPFVAVNCAAIPDGVADRLLFGGKKANTPIETIGHVQMARGGTLFLDEIADLDATAQTSLWRMVEAGTGDLGIAVGGHALRAAVAERRLRADLHGKLARAAVQLPPLRQRKVDIARLVQLDLAPPLTIHARLLESCLLRPWPGNVRELRAAVRNAGQAAGAAGRQLIRPEDLPEVAGMPPGTASGETAVERKQGQGIDSLERATIAAALERANGVVSVAARALGLHRSQLYRLLDQHRIAHDD
jgi:DNA-binding NtrC family response regulator